MTTIGIYGATDRFNYGDLLFPLVIEWAVRTYCVDSKILNFAIANSDYSMQGGIPTTRIGEALKTGVVEKCDRFVIAGGQVLDARWTAILGYILGSQTDIAVRGVRKILGEPFTDMAARKISGVPWPQPFVIPCNGLPSNVLVTYNAVGGAEIANLRPIYLKALCAGLQNAAYISVRDLSTQVELRKCGINAELVPDSAVVMSRIFPLSFLHSKLRDDLAKYVDESLGKYLVFQLGIKFLKGREEIIAKTISAMAEEQGLKVMLLAIGTATAHEDHIALAKINKHISPKCEVSTLFDGSLWEIMAVIASATLYVGTSLHGAITAMSFAVPRLAFSGEVRKLQEFLGTWDLEEFSIPLPVEGNSAIVARALSVSVADRQSLSEKVMDMASEGLRKVVSGV